MSRIAEDSQFQPSLTDSRELLLRLEQVGRTYLMGEVRVDVLQEVDLDIRVGEFLVIVGPSGSGKTTLLNLIGGMDKPTVGRIQFRQQDLGSFSSKELTQYRKEVIGFVFQFYNLVPTLNAIENVMVASELTNSALDPRQLLQEVGLAQREEHFPSQMSGGEQQRVSIARALAKDPELLLCDEPTGALDFETGKHILAVLLDVNRRMKKTVVIITHNAAIAQIADRVVRMRSGKIVENSKNPHPISPEDITW